MESNTKGGFMNPYWNIQEDILEKIRSNGGWVNCHAHIDRAYTITKENFASSQKLRSEKWILNDELRKTSTVDQIYDRMAQAIERMLEQGVTALGTFIDVDCNVKDKSIQAAMRVREKYKKDITIKYLNQSSNGLFNEHKEARQWFEVGAEFVDIIGGLLKADQGREAEHLDILLTTAKKMKKMVHVHVDELNIPSEQETELLAQKTIEHGMQGKVVGIHGISINARAKEERERIYTLIKKAKMMFIACPVSWLNERRSEELSPIHNPVTPVDEMLEYGIPVGIGTDNIADIFMPLNNADMWLDLRVLIEAARIYDYDEAVRISTTHGRKVLGIS
jgi:cytosine/creatinine deaminase